MEETFAHGNSYIHNLDPRAKVLVAAIFSIMLAIATRPIVLWLGLFLGLTIVFQARLKFDMVYKRLKVVNNMNVFLWFFLPLTFPGHLLLQLGPFHFTSEGCEMAYMITLRSNAILLFCIALLSSSSLVSIAHVFSSMKISNKLVYILFFTVRYITVIECQYEQLRRAMRLRCFKLRTNVHSYRSLAYLIGMLVIRSYARAKRVYQAMLCRGFKGEFYAIDRFIWTTGDTIFLCTCFCLIIGLGIAQWTRILI